LDQAFIILVLTISEAKAISTVAMLFLYFHALDFMPDDCLGDCRIA
jgi:hypothetical protein